jgi:Tol biopolymer transport system component
MAPEQARGRAVDRRADIWAFGCVLYEMLTGQPAFGGEDVTTTLARVLEREPSTAALPDAVPPAVRHTIELCLQKDVKKRLADIRDVRLALEGAFEIEAGGSLGREAVARPLWRRALPTVAGVLVGVLTTGLAVWAMMRPPSPAVARFDITPDGGVTVLTAALSVAVSPDGRSIAYVTGGDAFAGGQELRVRWLDQLGWTTLVTADEGGFIASPFFSPDGRQIGFWTPDSGLLKRVPIQGGAASTIARIPGTRSLQGVSWGTDGSIVFGTADPTTGLMRVRATGGEPETLTTPDPQSDTVDHLWPEILPGGQAVLFTMVGASEEESRIAVLSLSTGEQRVLLEGGTSPHYSATGHLLFGRTGTLFGVGFDATRLETLGDPVQVQEGVYTKGLVGAAEASVASNGTLLYLSRPQTVGARRLVWVDDAGRETSVPTPTRAYSQVVLSLDGTRAAVGLEGDKAIWLADLTRGTLQRLPADLAQGEPSVLFFSADGQRVASSATRDGRQAIVWQGIDGTVEAEPLATFDASVNGVRSGTLAPDGTRFVSSVLHGSLDLGVGDVGGSASYTDFVATPAQEFGSAISPDGHWIAYGSNETGTYQVYVQRFPEGGGRVTVSIGDGVWPYWSADGSALTYMQLDGGTIEGIVRVPVTGLGEAGGLPRFGRPEELFPWKYFAVANGIRQFAMTADGERFLMITGDLQGENARLVLVQNWFEELRRLVPAD